MKRLGQPSGLTYSDIPRWQIVEGWVKSSDWLPIPFDLVHLKKDIHEITLPGWWNGCQWDGMRVDGDTIYKFWKRVRDP